MSTKNLIYTGLVIVGAVVVIQYAYKRWTAGKGISATGSVLGTTAQAGISQEKN